MTWAGAGPPVLWFPALKTRRLGDVDGGSWIQLPSEPLSHDFDGWMSEVASTSLTSKEQEIKAYSARYE